MDDPVRTSSDLVRLRALEPDEDEPEVLQAIRLLRRELRVPLIGFAGAPFTLASYLVEGGPSKNHERTKALLYGDPVIWDLLMEALTSIVVAHLRAQVAAGVQALQVFDSWVGALHPDAYRRAVLPHMRMVFAGIADLGVPLIHFGVGTGELLGAMAEGGGDVIGIDWKTPLDAGWERVGGPAARGVQGNLDPTVLGAPWEVVERETLAVLEAAGGRDGHIFNLGHGVQPWTDPDTLKHLVDLVHEATERNPE